MTAFSDETGSVIARALAFYADPKRYRGSNQRNDGSDPWSGDDPYLKDINRDGGAIARAALSASTVAQEPVAWRWQENGWGDYWVYNPEPGWLAEQNNIVKQPLYTSPPATPAGLGADEIARLIHLHIKAVIDIKPGFFGATFDTKFDGVDSCANAILALLSRAGDQK